MCVLSVPSSHSSSPSCHTPSLSFLSPSSPLLIPLSDEQIELLNELFLWAPNAHPKRSICSFPPSVRLLLPPSHHPSISTLPPDCTSYSSACNNVYMCRNWGQEDCEVFRNDPKKKKKNRSEVAKFKSFNTKTVFKLVQKG